MTENTLFTAQDNNAVTSKKPFAKFAACSGNFDPKAVKGGNGEEEGGDGIVIEDDIIN